MQRERRKEKLQRADGTGRLLLTMGQNRFFLNHKADLVLLKGAKLFSDKLGFISFSM